MHSQRLGDLATVVGVVREQPHQDGLSRVELNLAIDLAVEFAYVLYLWAEIGARLMPIRRRRPYGCWSRFDRLGYVTPTALAWARRIS